MAISYIVTSIAENASHYPATEHITVELLEGQLTSRAQMTIKGCINTRFIGSHAGRKFLSITMCLMCHIKFPNYQHASQDSN